MGLKQSAILHDPDDTEMTDYIVGGLAKPCQYPMQRRLPGLLLTRM